MRRNIKGIKPKNKNKNKNNHKNNKISYRKTIKYIIIIIVIIMLVQSWNQFNDKIIPSILIMANLEATTLATRIINESVKEIMEEKEVSSEDFLIYRFTTEGQLVDCVVNTVLINEVSTDIINRITKKVKELSVYVIKIPLGSVLTSDILANYGPDLKVQILPAGTAYIDYERDFSSTGINQMNQRVWLNVNTTIQVVVPLATQKLEVKQKVVIVDRVINGDVPPNYVNVPESNILDVAN